MKNYFYGVSLSARSHFRNPASKSILFGNNYNHVRNMSGVQSVVSQQTIYLNKIDGRLSGDDKQRAINSRFKQIQDITGDNPDIKLDPAVFNAIAKGDEVKLQLQLEAPERRNLFIGLGVAASQLIGGLAGAAYSEQLGQFDIQRAQGDADFITKFGNNYKLNPFGGAEHQSGRLRRLTLIPIEQKKQADNNQQQETLKASTVQKAEFDAKVVASVKPGQRTAEVGTVNDAKDEKHLSVQDHREKGISEDGQTIEQNANKNLKSVYGTAVVQNGEDSSGTKGTVSAIVVREANLTRTNKNGELTQSAKDTQRATADYLRIAAASGLIKQSDLDDALKIKDPKERGKALLGLFDQTEVALNSKGITTKDDNLLGGQHITNIQKAANNEIKRNTDAAHNISDAFNGKGSITDDTVAIYNQVTGKNLTAKDLDAQIKSGDYTGVSETLGAIKSKVDNISSIINDTAKIPGAKGQNQPGLYARSNKVLGETLSTIPGFDTQIGDLQSVISERQQGKGGVTVTDSTGKQTTGDIKTTTSALSSDFTSGKLSKESQEQTLNTFGNVLAAQLSANGIKKTDGSAYTGKDALDIAKRISSGDTKDIDPRILGTADTESSKPLTTASNVLSSLGLNAAANAVLSAKPNISANFKAVGDLANSSVSVQQDPSAKKVSDAFDENKKNFSNDLSKQLAATGIKGDFSAQDIQAVAKQIFSGGTSNLEGKQKELFDAVSKDTSLAGTFRSFGNFLDASKKANDAVSEAIGSSSDANNSKAKAAVGSANTAADAFVATFNSANIAVAKKTSTQPSSGDQVSAVGNVTNGATKVTPTNPDGKQSGDQLSAVGNNTGLAKPETAPTQPSTEPGKEPQKEDVPLLDEHPNGYFSGDVVDRVKNAILSGQADQFRLATEKDLKSGKVQDPFKDDPEAKKLFSQINDKANLTETQKKAIQLASTVSKIADQVTEAFIQIADDILKKAFQDLDFDYGFSEQTKGLATGHESLTDQYKFTRQVGLARAAAYEQITKYDQLRKAESVSTSKSIAEHLEDFNDPKRIEAERAKIKKLQDEQAQNTQVSNTPVAPLP